MNKCLDQEYIGKEKDKRRRNRNGWGIIW
jgi:hypothetical protein